VCSASLLRDDGFAGCLPPSVARASGGRFNVTTSSTMDPLGTGGPPAETAAKGNARPAAASRKRPLCKPKMLRVAHLTRRYTVPPRGCGGIGRRARFRSVWGKPRGGSSPLIRISVTSGGFAKLAVRLVRAQSVNVPERLDERDDDSTRAGTARDIHAWIRRRPRATAARLSRRRLISQRCISVAL